MREQERKAGKLNQKTDFYPQDLHDGLYSKKKMNGLNIEGSVASFTSDARKSAAFTFSTPFLQHNVGWRGMGHTHCL